MTDMAETAEAAQTEPLNTETGERNAEDPEDVEIPNYPGMIPIKGKKKKIVIVLFLVFTILFLILNVTMFIVGVTSTKKCPIQPNIPVYLIVAGILGMATKALVAVYFCKDDIPLLQHIWHALLVIEVIWGIVGSYWVYSIYKPNFIQAPRTPYCDKTVYFLAFWLLTSHYIFGIFLLLVTFCLICGLLYTGFTSTAKRERN